MQPQKFFKPFFNLKADLSSLIKNITTPCKPKD